ncbi:hypothetical protein ACFS5M_08565 [Lacinutrix iliipiscaria]|uniref:Uncharacterized protein n=1 Tax=Lacinutrix iliipiscaria TaxID=1230532 RepID=A0ABW5WMN2_9FLAO
MASSFNFSLKASKPLSKLCLEKGYKDFDALSNYVQSLPYGRNTDRSDYLLILKEEKGTCSTKHAFLKQVAIENDALHIQFCLGLYKMSENNTKGIGNVLSKYKLSYIPEAHTYLKFNELILDFTRAEVSHTSFYKDLLFEEQILPEQIGNYKINKHKSFLKSWINSENVPHSVESIWKIREACIAQLSQ